MERDENQRPAIASLPEDLSGYDTIFIGYPIWWHTAPMIIGTFLENYDLTGVDIYPFTQSFSMDVGQFENSMEFVRESAAGANVHDGLFVRASDSEGMTIWKGMALRPGSRIFGEICVPQNAGKTMPAVIFSHGFGGNYQVGAQYAQVLATKGPVVYCFDFCGGSPGSRSDGSTLEMSIFTEQADLDAVTNASRLIKDGKVVGNTEFVAGIVQETLGADLFAIGTVQEYPGSHQPLLDFAYNEKAQNARPELAGHIDNPDRYDVIFVGFL